MALMCKVMFCGVVWNNSAIFRLRYPDRVALGPQLDARLSVFSGVKDQFATH
jgi:hypothetical protein